MHKQALKDVILLMDGRDQKHYPNVYEAIRQVKIQAEGCYWQVFPVLTAAESFIFYISVGSGAAGKFSRFLTSCIGIAFVFISMFSLHVKKQALDICTFRLFWLEVMFDLPRLNSYFFASIKNRRPWLFSLSLSHAWVAFMLVLLFCHALVIVDLYKDCWRTKDGCFKG